MVAEVTDVEIRELEHEWSVMTDEQRNPWDENVSESSQEDEQSAASSSTSDDATGHADSQKTTVLPTGAAATNSSSTANPYREAPQYGAYGPTPTSTPVQPRTTTQQATNTQPTQPITGLPFQDQNANQRPQQTQNPYGQQPNQSNQPLNGMFPFIPQPPVNGSNGNNNGNAGGDNNPYAGQTQNNRTPNNILVAVVAAVVTAAICLGVGYAALTNGWVSTPTSSSISGITSNQHNSGTATVEGGNAPDWSAVAANVSKSVVSIQTQISNGTAQGSGAILDKDGNIVTNNHVVSGAQRIVVTLDNGDIYEAKIVGTDTTTDLAVIKLENPPSDLTPVTFADSDNLTAGEPIMAIGNPLGYNDTVTTGIVSALNRPVSVMDENNTTIVTNAVQIDAAINPGNSGGPTFNAAGQVIGINSSIASMASSSDSAGSIGIGFAIPSNLVKRVTDEIIKDGKVQHVALGVTIQSTTVEADGVTRGGALVKSVVSGGPAADAGVKTGDVIVGYNGHAVSNNYSLLGFVRAAALGSTAKLTIVRDGKTIEVDVKLDKAEDAVNGTNRQDSNSNQNNNNNNQNNDNQNNNDDNGLGGLLDPFGQW